MQQGALAQSQQELTQAQHTQRELWQQRQSRRPRPSSGRSAGRQSLAETRAQLQQAAAAGGTPATTAQPDSPKHAGKHRMAPALRAGTAPADNVASTTDGTG